MVYPPYQNCLKIEIGYPEGTFDVPIKVDCSDQQLPSLQ
jgi:hypothetical protein